MAETDILGDERTSPVDEQVNSSTGSPARRRSRRSLVNGTRLSFLRRPVVQRNVVQDRDADPPANTTKIQNNRLDNTASCCASVPSDTSPTSTTISCLSPMTCRTQSEDVSSNPFTPTTTSAGSALTDASTPKAAEHRVCRFCFEGDSDDSMVLDDRSPGQVFPDRQYFGQVDADSNFVTPCPCRGSSRFVHLDCLVRHFVARGQWHHFVCPTCKQTYEGKALRELARLSYQTMLRMHGENAPETAHSLCYLAQAHAQLGQVRENKQLLEQSLLIFETRFGADHIATAATLAELASAHGKLGDVNKQKELLERSLKIKVQHFGPGHINTAVTLNNLATAHSELGNIRQEKTYLERSLEIKEKHYGKGHVQTTAALVNLAGVYSELGDVTAGQKLLQWSLDIEERHFGPGHVETAITLNNLALACGESGDLEKMRELLVRSLQIKEHHFGAEHQELCLTLANLGLACAVLGNTSESKIYCDRALAASSFPGGKSSRRHGVVFLRTASVYLSAYQKELFDDLWKRAVNTLGQALGPSASLRVLGLECTRMARIWKAVNREDIVSMLMQLKAEAAENIIIDSQSDNADDDGPAHLLSSEIIVSM